MPDTEGLQEVTHTPPNPMDVDVPKRTCAQQDDMVNGDTGEYLGQVNCGLDLVYERHGDEIVYMCTDHGWQATVFEERSGE